MNNDIQEALTVVKLMFKDVTDQIVKTQCDLDMEQKLVDKRRTDFVEITLPDLSATTFLKLIKNFPIFAERHYVAEMFEKFQPRRFMIFWKRQPKADPTSLALVRMKFEHWLIDNDNSMFDQLNHLTDYLEMWKDRQTKLAELITILTALKNSNKPIPDNVRQRVNKLRDISHNHPNHPISDDYYFEEDWIDIVGLVTELFIVYEAFQSEAFAETIIPEQLSQPDPFEGVEWDTVDNLNEVVDNTSNQESIATNDSLGYFS